MFSVRNDNFFASNSQKAVGMTHSNLINGNVPLQNLVGFFPKMSLAPWLIKQFCTKSPGTMLFSVYILLVNPTFKADKVLFTPVKLKHPYNHDIITMWVCINCDYIIV